jgi:hypothetical protein
MVLWFPISVDKNGGLDKMSIHFVCKFFEVEEQRLQKMESKKNGMAGSRVGNKINKQRKELTLP